eukprot:363759-Chlamydomonas_euryale.AAC.7
MPPSRHVAACDGLGRFGDPSDAASAAAGRRLAPRFTASLSHATGLAHGQLPPCRCVQVKRAIGWTRTEDNAGLFAEAEALAEILGDVQLSNTQLQERQRLLSNPQRGLVGVEVHMHMVHASTRMGAGMARIQAFVKSRCGLKQARNRCGLKEARNRAELQ